MFFINPIDSSDYTLLFTTSIKLKFFTITSYLEQKQLGRRQEAAVEQSFSGCRLGMNFGVLTTVFRNDGG